ncbi:hypothetical protein KFL_014930010, partial [Klebsormidium nitens]
ASASRLRDSAAREAQANNIDQTRLQHAVTRADTLFAGHVALDGTKVVERHRFAARKAKLQHRYVTTTGSVGCPQALETIGAVHFAPAARLHQGPVYQTQPIFIRPDKTTYKGPYQPAPYRPPQLFPKYPQYRQPYPQQYQQQPFRKLTWKSNNYYEPLN